MPKQIIASFKNANDMYEVLNGLIDFYSENNMAFNFFSRCNPNAFYQIVFETYNNNCSQIYIYRNYER